MMRACSGRSFATLLLLAGLWGYAGQAGAAALSLDAIRPDAEQSAAWNGRFAACESFLPNDWDMVVTRYGIAFYERTRQDLARQKGDPAFSFNNETIAADPELKRYFDALETIRVTQTAAAQKAQSATAPACQRMLQDFEPYILAFIDRVDEPTRKEREAQLRAEAPYRAWLEKLDRAMGRNGLPSQPATLGQLLASQPEFAASLEKEYLCQATGYSDAQGLQYLISSTIGPRLLAGCPYGKAFAESIYRDRFDNAAWLAQYAGADAPSWAKILIEQGIWAGKDRQTALMPVLDQLFAGGLKANAQYNDLSLLSWTLRDKTSKFTVALLDHGADPNSIVQDGVYGRRPILTAAVQLGDMDLFKQLLHRPGIRVNDAEHGQSTALAAAIAHDRAQMAQMLFDAGAKLSTMRRYNQNVSPLASAKNPAMIALLLAHGANPRWVDPDGNTALLYMLLAYHDDQLLANIRALVAAGLPINRKNKYGATVLNYVDQDTLYSTTAEREALIALGAKLGESDKRVSFAYGRGQPVIGRPYRIKLENGKTLEGITDSVGKASWVPDGQKYQADIVRKSY